MHSSLTRSLLTDPMIALKDIRLHFGEFELFKGLNLNIKQKDKLALIGRNGAGKSTLFRLILGHISPSGGSLDIPRGTTIGILEQDISLDQGVSVRDAVMSVYDHLSGLQRDIENIQAELETTTDQNRIEVLSINLAESFEQLGHYEPEKLEAEMEKIMVGLGFKSNQLSAPVGHFSGGWQMRILLGRLLLLQPDFMLLDEPTNHLDIVSIIWLEQYLKDYPGAYVVISHDKRFMDNVASRVAEIELGKIHVYDGDFSKYEQLKAERRAIAESAYKNQQKEIERKEKLINKFRAKASKASMAQSLISELKRMDRLELEAVDHSKMKIVFPPAPRSAETVVKARRLTKHYDDNQVFNDLDFEILRGQRVSLIGQNGQGKTTMVKIISDRLEPTAGEYKKGSQVIEKYFAQDEGEQLDGSLTVLDWMTAQSTEETRSRVRSVLGAFLFRQEDVDKKISVLSGGERSRLALAGMLLSPMNFLIMDEPTNHLDMVSKQVLKDALKGYDGSLLVISHDRDFLDGLTDDTFVLHNGKIKHHLGDVSSFLEKEGFESLEAFSLSAEKVMSPDKVEREKTYGKGKPIDKQRQRKIQYLERDIDRLEVLQKEIEAEMSKPEFYESENQNAVLNKYEAVKKELENKMEEWEGIIDN